MRLGLLLLLCLAPVWSEVPLRLGHTGGVTGDLAQRVSAALPEGFHVSLVGPDSDARLGDDLTLLRATLAGDFQLAWVRSTALANFHRPWGLLSIPYLFDDLDSERAWMTSGRLLRSTRGLGLRALTAVELGPRLFASREPLGDLEGLRGLTVVAPKDRFSLDFLRELGARPVAALDPEVMRTTEARGCETNLVDLAWRRLGERYPHLLFSDHGLEYVVLVVNERAFARLNAHQQAQLERARPHQLRVLPEQTPGTVLTSSQRASWRARLKDLRSRSLRLIGLPWSMAFH